MGRTKVAIEINGEVKSAEVESRMLLVHFIREVADLTGTHIGCDSTNCGACTVLLDGKAVKSCTILAAQASGRKVTTVEGLSKDGALHPVQEAFVEKHGLQCGYCTPGMIMSATWLLSFNVKPTEEDIRKYISGNLCRCTGYQDIIDSVKLAAEKMTEAK